MLKKRKKEEISFFNGTYKAIEIIGEGSFGKVYKVKKDQYGIESFCAVKTINVPQSDSELIQLKKEGMDNKKQEKYFESVVKKWVDEIQLMQQFKDNNNVVNIEDYEIIKEPKELKWTINIRMELLTSLDIVMMQEKITNKKALKMAIDISKAMEECEKNKIIHRDIKPENIFVNKKEVYKLGDFGVAKKAQSTISNLSKKGTENYMAPEIYQNGKGDNTTDIYSLGIVLYRFFNYNRLPFLPDYPKDVLADDYTDAIEKRMSGEKMKPPINAPKNISDIILKMCEYYPADRYQSSLDLMKDLEKAYSSIEKEEVLFYLEDKKMTKLSHQNTKKTSHDKTVSVYSESEELKTQDSDEKATEKPTEKPEEKVEENQEKKEQKNEKESSEKSKTGKIKGKKPIQIKKIIPILSAIIVIGFVVIILILNNQTKKEEMVIMPNVVKSSSEKATKKLQSLRLNIEYEYEEVDEEKVGIVLSQSIDAKKKIARNTLVKIKVGVSKEKIEVIDITGKTKEEAKSELESLGFIVNFNEKNSDDVESGRVISQLPIAGEKIAKGTIIEVLVSIGKSESNNTQSKENSNKQSSINSDSTTPSNPPNKNWSDWVEQLPDGVTKQNYTIEEKTQYSYRTYYDETLYSETQRPECKIKERVLSSTKGTKIESECVSIERYNEIKGQSEWYSILELSSIICDVTGYTCVNHNNSQYNQVWNWSMPENRTCKLNGLKYEIKTMTDYREGQNCTSIPVGGAWSRFDPITDVTIKSYCIRYEAYYDRYEYKATCPTSWSEYSDKKTTVYSSGEVEYRTRKVYRYKLK